jgi:hypothetical protein
MTPSIEISTLTIDADAGTMADVRVLLRAIVQDVRGSKMTLVSLESEDGVGKTRMDHLVLGRGNAAGLAEALRTVLARRGLGEAGS